MAILKCQMDNSTEQQPWTMILELRIWIHFSQDKIGGSSPIACNATCYSSMERASSSFRTCDLQMPQSLWSCLHRGIAASGSTKGPCESSFTKRSCTHLHCFCAQSLIKRAHRPARAEYRLNEEKALCRGSCFFSWHWGIPRISWDSQAATYCLWHEDGWAHQCNRGPTKNFWWRIRTFRADRQEVSARITLHTRSSKATESCYFAHVQKILWEDCRVSIRAGCEFCTVRVGCSFLCPCCGCLQRTADSGCKAIAASFLSKIAATINKAAAATARSAVQSWIAYACAQKIWPGHELSEEPSASTALECSNIHGKSTMVYQITLERIPSSGSFPFLMHLLLGLRSVNKCCSSTHLLFWGAACSVEHTNSAKPVYRGSTEHSSLSLLPAVCVYAHYVALSGRSILL